MNGLIICAGKNSRFGGEKALAKVNDITNLERNHKFLNDVVNDIYVVIREDKKETYINEFPNTNYVTVNESRGCGQAVRDALHQVPDDKYLIIWGDMVLYDNKFLDLIPDNDRLNIFLEEIKNPYTCFNMDDKGQILNPIFCKQDNIPMETGFTDRGLYIVPKQLILPYLDEVTPNHHNEYHFYDVFPKMYADNIPLVITYLNNSGIRTFNTKKELEEILIEHKDREKYDKTRQK